MTAFRDALDDVMQYAERKGKLHRENERQSIAKDREIVADYEADKADAYESVLELLLPAWEPFAKDDFMQAAELFGRLGYSRDEAASAFRLAVQGEYEPLQRMGIDIQSDVPTQGVSQADREQTRARLILAHLQRLVNE